MKQKAMWAENYPLKIILKFAGICSLIYFQLFATGIAQTKSPDSFISGLVKKQFSNGIELEENGLRVREAYLLFNNNTRVSDINKIELNQQVNLRLVISGGFKVVDGKVFPGGNQTMELSGDKKNLSSDDVFAAYDSTGVNPKDAQYLTLKNEIMTIDDKKNNVKVSFLIWDKRNDLNFIKGSYTLKIK